LIYFFTVPKGGITKRLISGWFPFFHFKKPPQREIFEKAAFENQG